MSTPVLTKEVLTRVSEAVETALPPGFAFVLLIDNGRGEAAMLSPHGADVAYAIVAAALEGVKAHTDPDLVIEVQRVRGGS